GVAVAIRIAGIHRRADPRRRCQLGNDGAYRAVVLGGLACVDAPLELHATTQPRADVEQHSVVALVLFTDVVSQRDVVAGLSELAGDAVVGGVHGAAAPAR